MTPFQLFPATSKNKRFGVYVPKGKGQIKVQFGSPDYENYTMHRDSERKQRYIDRHRHDNLTDPYSSGFWSMHVLWNKPSLSTSMKDAVKKAKKYIQ